MLLRVLAVLFVWISSLVLVGCSDAPSKVEVVAEPAVEPVSAPVAKTTGVLHYDGLPPGSVTAAEVMVVEKLSDAARERIERQRVLFEYKITGRVEESVEAVTLAGVSKEDGAYLQAALSDLSTKVPPVLVKDVDLGNNRLRKYQSDRELFQEYQYLFGAVTWENVERGLKFIGEKIEADNQALVQRAEALEGDAYEQVRVSLDWLESVHGLYESYVALANQYGEAQQRYIREQAALESAPKEPTDWDAYASMYAHQLIMDTSEHLLGSALAAEDGSFEVEAHGLVIVRVELGVVSAYFLPDAEYEQRVRMEGLKQL